jgi:hypothetical protein
VILWKSCHKIVIQNNIFCRSDTPNAVNFLSDDLRDVTIRNNLVFGTGLKDNTDRGVSKLANNLVGLSPLFRDPARLDLRLLRNSPAIDSGTDELAPSVDALGNPRPHGRGYDMGAYEYGSTPGSRR